MNRSIYNVQLFASPADYATFAGLLIKGLIRTPIEVLAYCLMPSHWHLVLRSGDIRKISCLMHWLTTTHAKRWHYDRDNCGLGPVYKGRFLSVPLAEAGDVIRVVRYVERNPLKAGLVDRAEDWRWSSLAERLRGQSALPLVRLPVFDGSAWVECVNQPAFRSDEDELEHLEETAAAKRERGVTIHTPY